MEEYQITEISEKDNPSVAKMIREVFEEYGAPAAGTVYEDPTTDCLSKVFEEPRSVFYVAKKGNKIVGSCGIFPTEGLPKDTCELVKFYISNELRGKGLGKILMQKCYEKSAELGYRQMYIESLPAFAKAVSIYEKQGFKHLSQPLGNSGHSGCNIWMLKQLVGNQK